ncbi:MAG: NUDIX domain-containing protein [Spirochaetes bacterium]|nr:NUDIX domain-containing protein [Spirochaetota bacterium]
MKKKIGTQLEFFDIVDESGSIIAKKTRKKCHDGSKLLHPVVHVHIINSKKMILLQKRALSKEIQPGKWDTSVGGHIQSGETVINAILRESFEETGIKINPDNLIFVKKYIFESDIERELVYTHVYYSDEKVKFQKSEIDEVNFFTKNEVIRLINENKTTPNFNEEFLILKSFDKNLLI